MTRDDFKLTIKGKPNMGFINEKFRDYQWIISNVKQMALELAKSQSSTLSYESTVSRDQILGSELTSKLCTQADLQADSFRYWLNELKIPFYYHRKFWELCYVMHAVEKYAAKAGHGLGFAVGDEPLPSWFTHAGHKIMATDAPAELSKGWSDTNQHADRIEKLFKEHLVSREVFFENATFQTADMNNIPKNLTGYDFCWSVCSFEHLGSLQKGEDFVVNSLNTVKPGGLAVHTTEFNVSSNDETIDNWGTVIYRRQDIEKLIKRLESLGHTVFPMDWSPGDSPLDNYIDIPPWDIVRNCPHLKLSVDGFACTSIGLIIRKAA